MKISNGMEHIGAHIRTRRRITAKQRATERGELMEYFCEQLNLSRIHDGFRPISMARMGRILEGIPTKDLYYLKSVCVQADDFSKKFWWEIDPKRHEKGTPRFARQNFMR